MRKINIVSSVEEAKELARKELLSLGLEVDLNSLKYEVALGRSSKVYNDEMPMVSAIFNYFEETPIEEAEKCIISLENEDGYTAQAIISDKNIAKASKVIANAILMSYAGMVE